jgi:Tfp pilus assembly protein PilF
MRAMLDIIRPMRVRPLLPGLVATVTLSACALFRAPPSQPAPAGTGASPAGSAQPAQPAPPTLPEGAPVLPAQPSTPSPAKEFHLGSASSALVTQAHQQTQSGDTALAAATLERAVRIEPDNPLVWIELGRGRLAENNAAQADAMGRKALALATGDVAAQSSAWRLIADALRARGDNGGAADADRRAASLAPR